MSFLSQPGQEIAGLDFASLIGGPLNAVVDAQAKAAMSSINFIKEVGFKKPAKKQGDEDSATLEPINVKFKFPKEVEPYQPMIPARVGWIEVTSPGSGYKSAPKVTISGGEGTGATATATIDSEGKLSSIAVTNPGAGYKSAPTVTLVVVDGGSGATATAHVEPEVPARPAQIQMMELEVPILTMLPVPYIRVEEVTIDFNAKITSIEWAQIDTSVDASVEYSAGGSYSGFTAGMKATTSAKMTTSMGTNIERTYDMHVNVKAVQNETPAGLERLLNILEGAIRAQPANALKPVVR
jgi:hypothetical protein